MRKITALTLVVAGFIELVTSIVLYIIPSGRVAYWSDYHLFGLSKTQWGDIHITVGTLLLIMVSIHIYFNWRPITAYIKNKARQLTVFTKSFNIALLISLYVAVGTLYNLFPMNYVLHLGEYFTETANKKYGEPPYGHAELSSLKMFCNRMNIDLGKAVALLREAGVEIKGAQETVIDISKKSGYSPQQIYDLIKSASIEQKNGEVLFPEAPSPGFGTKTIKDICEIYSLSVDEVLTHIRNAGFSAQATETVKEVGTNNDSNPMVIFEIIKGVAEGQTPEK